MNNASSADEPFLLGNASVIDGTGRPPLARARVLVDGGRIAAIGSPDRIETPAGCRVLDLTGRTIVPGLVDLHVHSTFGSDMRAYLANGVTSIRFAGIDGPSFRRVRDAIESGTIPGPRVFTLGPMLDVEPPSWPEWTETVASPVDARRVAERLLAEERTDGLIAVQGITPQLLRPIVETAHSHGRPVMGQLWRTDGAEAAAIGIDQLDNTARIAASRDWADDRLYGYRSVSERMVILSRLWTSLDWSGTERIMEAMLEADVAYCPTLVVLEHEAGLAHEVVENDPAYREFYGPEERAAWAVFNRRVAGSWSGEEAALWRAAIEPRMEWIRRYRQGGGRILIGTDMQFGGIGIHRELELLRDVGFSPLELIAIATGGAAHAMGLADRLGTIEPGKLADLVVLSGDPLRDLRALRGIEFVLKGGRVVTGRPPDEPEPNSGSA